MSDKIQEKTGLKIIEVLKKGNLNFNTNMLDKASDQKLDEIIDEAVKEWGDKDD